MLKEMNSALALLCEKYGAPAGTISGTPGAFRLDGPSGGTVLLPWRVERRFTELKKIIDGKTLEGVSTFRFARFQSGGELAGILTEELDLAAFLSGGRVTRVFSSGDAKIVCNTIFMLSTGVSGCVECGVNLPAGEPREDRHEIIARRGVASDQAVDTQVPQSSIYLRTAGGVKTFTDVDTELFGLPNSEIWTVRAALAALADPKLCAVWNAAADAARRGALAALDSSRAGKPITL